jgi:hypothetical protein
VTGLRKFKSPRFKAGLRLLLENMELAQALGITDHARVPKNPSGLCQLVRHRFANKSFPEGATFHLSSQSTDGEVANVGVFFFKSGLRAGFRNFGSLNSSGAGQFFFWETGPGPTMAAELDHVFVTAEGLFMNHETKN